MKREKDVNTVVKHLKVKELLGELQRLMETKGVNSGQSLSTYAVTGPWKARAINKFCEMYPQRHEPDREIFPVVSLVCPESTTPKRLASDILKAYRHPAYNKGAFYDRRERLFNYISECGTKLIVIDEHRTRSKKVDRMPNIRTSGNLDYLKELVNLTRVAIAIVETDRRKKKIR